ncbi:hypothetical protein LguiA_019697 [Lonicera macranthoides]
MGGGKARSAAERTGSVHDKTIMNQIMLRFRPIAPKPAGDGDTSGSGDPKNKGLVGKKRAKRKYVRINKNKVSVKQKFEESAVTLQLLPPVLTEKSPAGDLPGSDVRYTEVDLRSSDPTPPPVMQVQNWEQNPVQSDENNCNSSSCSSIEYTLKKKISITSPFHFTSPSNLGSLQTRIVESWVTMECVTDGCENQGWLGGTDAEMLRNLEGDTCPGFVFDGVDVVQWVNLSYKRMVVGPAAAEDDEVVVWVAVKGRFPAERGAFTCRLRVVYCRNEREKHKVTVPCDVWKMEYGGFACRLDVEAALSLGR